MRHSLYILLFGLILVGCNPFHEDRVMNYESDLIEIANFMKDYENVTLDSDSDDRFAAKMRRYDIDKIVKNYNKQNKRYSGFIEGSDSLFIFIKRSHSIIRPEKRIIYDFASKPRNFGSDTIDLAAYRIIQLSDRWYYSTEGFD
jgi:hypothetical protein